jgi:hypothetical protein
MAFAFLAAGLMWVAPEEFDAQKAAAIEHAQAKEAKVINAKYGNRKSTELTRDERAAMIREQQAAEQKVLAQFGVSQRDWARMQMGRTREQADKVRQEREVLEAKEKIAAAEAAQKTEQPTEILIQRGVSEDSPVVLEDRTGDVPVVEQGLGKEYEADVAAAADADAADRSDKEAPAKPAKGTRKQKP